MRSPRRDATALIDEDSIQPRAEPVPLLIPTQRPIGAKEGRLQCILRVIAVAQHSDCKTRASIVVPINELRVCINVAGQHTLHVGGIVAHVLCYNPPPRRLRHITRLDGFNARSGVIHRVTNVTPPVDSSANCGALASRASGCSHTAGVLWLSDPAESGKK